MKKLESHTWTMHCANDIINIFEKKRRCNVVALCCLSELLSKAPSVGDRFVRYKCCEFGIMAHRNMTSILICSLIFPRCNSKSNILLAMMYPSVNECKNEDGQSLRYEPGSTSKWRKKHFGNRTEAQLTLLPLQNSQLFWIRRPDRLLF